MYFENIIVGAGPAGIQMGYFFERTKQSYVILERNDVPGSFFKQYPRNRRLISVNKVRCGASHRTKNIENILRYDWNSLLTLPQDHGKILFKDFSDALYPPADALCDYLQSFVNIYHLSIWYNTSVQAIHRLQSPSDKDPESKSKSKSCDENPVFRLTCNQNQLTHEQILECKRLFIASGLQCNGFPVKPAAGYPHVYTYENVRVDRPFFLNKRVLILGGGNAAFEIANCINDAAHTITLSGADRFAWKTHYPGNIRSVNMTLLDSYYLKLKVNLDWSVGKFMRHSDKFRQYLQQLSEPSAPMKNNFDIVIGCLGFSPNIAYLNATSTKGSIEIEKDARGFPLLTPFFESINCPNLYFIGALSQGFDWKRGTSAFIHGFRYNIRATFESITQTYRRFQISRNKFPDLATILLERINKSSCLLHRFDFFADYIFIRSDKSMTYYCDMPGQMDVRHIQTHLKEDPDSYALLLKIHLGYDKRNTFLDTFFQPQTGSLELKDASVLIHPILHVFKVSECQELDCLHTFHFPEHAFNYFIDINNHVKYLYDILMVLSEDANRITPASLQSVERYARFQALTHKVENPYNFTEFLDN